MYTEKDVKKLAERLDIDRVPLDFHELSVADQLLWLLSEYAIEVATDEDNESGTGFDSILNHPEYVEVTGRDKYVFYLKYHQHTATADLSKHADMLDWIDEQTVKGEII